MDRDRKRQKRQQRQERQDADWIFASDDPRTLPTDRLPDREEFDRYAAPLLARRAGQAALPEIGRASCRERVETSAGAAALIRDTIPTRDCRRRHINYTSQ